MSALAWHAAGSHLYATAAKGRVYDVFPWRPSMTGLDVIAQAGHFVVEERITGVGRRRVSVAPGLVAAKAVAQTWKDETA